MRSKLRTKIAALALIAPIGLGACEGMSNQQVGQLIGAVGGAYLGSEVGDGDTGAIILGGFLGSFIGGKIGAHLDARDRQMMYQTTQRAMESAPDGTTQSWSNPDSGASGAITPQTTFQSAQGPECRQFSQTVSAQGEQQYGTGTACRQADGSWEVVS